MGKRLFRVLKSRRLEINRTAATADEKLNGELMIRGTGPSLSAENADPGYPQSAEREHAFRMMKSCLDLRP